ncbi:MAG: EAL domain-containing protein [Azonexus sp.]|jgi:EAL domain-containing protein (putative c-di-GMP-specific phosphodiesterase class I)|nr:EAL domain-containing protein [Azonexus sp.]
MPLTDLIRYFNVADTSGESTLYLDGKRAAAWHGGLHLGSLFQPIVDLRQERVVGHQARLVARRQDGSAVSSEEAYAACETAESVVHFDRLCRTLHALNFLAQQQQAGGYLQLAVHPRHLLAVQNQHGLVYEAILKRCGLAPQDIVLQVDASLAESHSRLDEALRNYRQRGYRLALAGQGAGWPNPAAQALAPDIIQLPQLPTERQHLPAGSLIELTGVDSGHTYEQARAAGIDLAQGPLFGDAQADCRPTHDQGRVAYNSASLSGVRHENRQ